MQFKGEVFLCLGLICFNGMFWLVIPYILASISGWRRLAKHYSGQTKFIGEKWYLQSGHVGSAHYKGIFIIGLNEYGFYLSVLPVFGLGHSPLLIPWGDISLDERKEWLKTYLILTVVKVPTVSLKLSVSRDLKDRIVSMHARAIQF